MDALLGRGTDRVVGIVLGRTAKSVSRRREKLGIPSIRGTGRHVDPNGYVVVTLAPDDPMAGMARSGRSVMQHRLVMARHLGRPLEGDEFVHHRNGVRGDNRLENLELWTRSHPDGQRVEDVLEWAIEFVERYVVQNEQLLAGKGDLFRGAERH